MKYLIKLSQIYQWILSIIIKRYNQYFKCKHTNKILVKKIMDASGYDAKPKFFDKMKCEKCDRIFYSKYYYEYGNERHYI